MELWRDIPGYEGLYQASNLGNIRTCEGKTTSNKRFETRRWKQRIMRQKISRGVKGREDARVCLWKDGAERTWLVARLIGITWCDGWSESLTINHINGNHLDNRAENLEWVTLGENIKKGFSEGLYSGIQKSVILESAGKERLFSSLSEGSRFLGRSKGYLCDCIKRSKPAFDTNGVGYSVRLGG